MIRTWLARLSAKFGTKGSRVRKNVWPTREEIAELPAFDALGFDHIIEIATAQGAERAYQELLKEHVVGFDTESKPTFVKGQVSTGPHVAQFSTLNRAYIFLLHHEESRRAAISLIRSRAIKKVGFGLSEDLRLIKVNLGATPRAILDLETLFAEKGYGRGVGVKVAVAIALRRRFMKSKRASTSNWMNRRLTDQQVLYAANDAYAAIRVFSAFHPRSRR